MFADKRNYDASAIPREWHGEPRSVHSWLSFFLSFSA